MTAALSGLTIGSLALTPAFDPAVTAYTATAANPQDTVTATPGDSGAVVSIRVNGTAVANSAAVSWQAGSNTVVIEVANGTEQAQYTVAVGYAPPADPRLSALTIGSLTLTPAFDPDVADYTADTANNTNTINATPMDAGTAVHIDVDGTNVSNGTAATWASGTNTVTVKVESGGAGSTYTVIVTKT